MEIINFLPATFFLQLQDPVSNAFTSDQVGDDARLEGAQEGFRLEAVVDHDEADRGLDDLLVRDADDLVSN